MKKIIFAISLFLLIPSFVNAEETISNGDVITPVGTISVYAGLESNSQLLKRGYLIADGSSVSIDDYPELYKVIENTYGTAESGYFKLPNLQGKTAVGVKENDSDFGTLGQTGGERTVTLTTEQMPKHTHTFTGTSSTTSVESNSHSHTFSGTTSTKALTGSLFTLSDSNYKSTGIITSTGEMTLAELASGTSIGGTTYTIDATHSHTFNGTTSSSSTTHTHTFKATGTNAETGSSKAHNNLQPYIALKYIIKVK